MLSAACDVCDLQDHLPQPDYLPGNEPIADAAPEMIRSLPIAAGMMEAAKGFRRLKAYKHLPVLRAALAAHQSKYVTQRVEHDADVA